MPSRGTHCISHCTYFFFLPPPLYNSFCFCFRVTLSQQLFAVDVGREGWLGPRGHEMICFSWIRVIDTICAGW